jgi:hypothetical protein
MQAASFRPRPLPPSQLADQPDPLPPRTPPRHRDYGKRGREYMFSVENIGNGSAGGFCFLDIFIVYSAPPPPPRARPANHQAVTVASAASRHPICSAGKAKVWVVHSRTLAQTAFLGSRLILFSLFFFIQNATTAPSSTLPIVYLSDPCHHAHPFLRR